MSSTATSLLAAQSTSTLFFDSLTHRVNYGFFFGGLYIAGILFGITIVQASTFFFVHQRDPMLHKWVVTTVLVFDMLHLALVANSFFSYVVIKAGATEPPEITWSCVAFYVLETITIAIAHCMYALRLWTLAARGSRLKYVQVVSLLILIATTFASGIAVAAFINQQASSDGSNFINAFDNVYATNLLNLLLNCTVDLTVVVILTPALRDRTQHSWTSSTFMLLIAYALNTGIFNLIFSLSSLIAFAAWRRSPFFLTPRIMLMTGILSLVVSVACSSIRPVHVNSLIGMFNARFYFRTKSPTTVVLQAHETALTVSKLGEVRATPLRSNSDSEKCTINDAGLPLFSKDPNPVDPHRPPVVMVNVQTMQDKHVSPMPEHPYTYPSTRT